MRCVEVVCQLTLLRLKFIWPDSNRLFFIEGGLTVAVALVAVFVLPDFPSTSRRWLSPIEVRLAVKRMEEDAGIGDKSETEVKGQGQILAEALSDWRVMYMGLKYVVLVPTKHASNSCAP